jgi:hypothetical protein
MLHFAKIYRMGDPIGLAPRAWKKLVFCTLVRDVGEMLKWENELMASALRMGFVVQCMFLHAVPFSNIN